MPSLVVAGLALLALMQAPSGEAPPPESAENIPAQVEGSRYDLGIEIGERFDRYRDEAQTALTKRAAALEAIDDRLDVIMALQSKAAGARLFDQRLADLLAAQDKALDPVCRYLAGARDEPALSAPARALLDLLQATDREPSADTLRRCRQPPISDSADATTACTVLLWLKPEYCGSAAKDGDDRACRAYLAPDPDHDTFFTYRGELFLAAWSRSKRQKDRTLLDTPKVPWFREMVAAIDARAPERCPTWTAWRGAYSSVLGLDPDHLFDAFDGAIDLVPPTETQPARLIYTARCALDCTVTLVRGEEREVVATVPLAAKPGGLSETLVDAPVPADGERLVPSCQPRCGTPPKRHAKPDQRPPKN